MIELPEKFQTNRKLVAIQGLGFVGAAMALVIASAKDKEGQPLYNVIGIDIPNEEGFKKTTKMNSGKFPFKNNDKKLQQAHQSVYKNGNLWTTTDSQFFQYADIVVVDINLDIKFLKAHQPVLDLTLFKEAMHTLGKYLKAGVLVVVETTVPPGTCEKVVYPILCEEVAKRNIKRTDLFVAHS